MHGYYYDQNRAYPIMPGRDGRGGGGRRGGGARPVVLLVCA